MMEAVRNGQNAERIREADEIFREAEAVWCEEDLPVIDRDVRARVRETACQAVQTQVFAKDYADACEAFYLFRKLHSFADQMPAWAVLTGDFFFSRFSHALIPIDSVELIDRISDYLKEDVKMINTEPDLEGYLAFIRQTALEISL